MTPVEMLHETGSFRTSFERSGSEGVESPRSGKQAVGLIPTTCNADSACAQYSKRMAMLQDVTLAAPLGEGQSVVRSVYTRRDEGNRSYITGCSPHVTLLCTSGTNPEQWRTRQCSCMHEVRLIPLWPVFPPFQSVHYSSRMWLFSLFLLRYGRSLDCRRLGQFCCTAH